MEYIVEVTIGEENYHAEMEILLNGKPQKLLIWNNFLDNNMPSFEGMKRYSRKHRDDPEIRTGYSGAKSNTNHNSTRQRLLSRMGRNFKSKLRERSMDKAMIQDGVVVLIGKESALQRKIF